MSAPDFKQVAAQLRMPRGEDGIQTAAYMSVNNRNMIEQTINLLELQPGDSVLEIGYGGGQHLSCLLAKAKDISYRGIDISATMQGAAALHNKDLKGDYTFLQADAKDGFLELPFGDNTFDRIFTVNTIYFWDNPMAQAKELCRVLKPGGHCIVSFGSRSFMEGLPFTQYGFELYDAPKANDLLSGAGLTVIRAVTETELVPGMEADGVMREFIMLYTTKAQA